VYFIVSIVLVSGGVVARGWFTIMFLFRAGICFSYHISAVVVGGSGGLEIWVIEVMWWWLIPCAIGCM
jgi:hypothetical protein